MPRFIPDTENRADGIAWVPGRAYTLVFATSSVCGKAALSLWQSGSHFPSLVKVRYPDDQNFQLCTISRDGYAITYLHGPKGYGDENTFLRRSLQLPKP